MGQTMKIEEALGEISVSAGPARHAKVPVGRIDPDPEQPRKTFDPAGLEELSESIREHGLLQPVLLRPEGPRFILIAGERRWRACKMLGLPMIESKIFAVDAKRAFEMAVAENVQRNALLPIEEARAYARLIEQHQMRQADIARRLDLDRRRVSEKLRLLALPESVLALLSAHPDNFTEAHALILACAGEGLDIAAIAQQCAAKGWSVRHLKEVLTHGVPAKRAWGREHVRLNVHRSGGFTMTARASGRTEVEAALRELERAIDTLKTGLLERLPSPAGAEAEWEAGID